MRILIINRRHFPEFVGGSYRYCYDVAQHLALRGHEVHIIYCTINPEHIGDILENGVYEHRYYVKSSNPVSENYGYITSTRRIAEKLHREKPFDLVNFHCPRAPLALFKSDLFKSTPFVFNCQADSAFEYKWDYEKNIAGELSPVSKIKEHIVYPFHYHWLRYCMKKALERSNGIIVLSDYVRNTIREHYGTGFENKIIKIPSGVDIERFRPPGDTNEKILLRQKFGLPHKRLIFITVRRLALRMGLMNLVEAVNLLLEDNPAFREQVYFVLIGKGPLKEQLEQRIAGHGLEDVIHLAGFINDEDLPLYYRCADASIVPTEELEGFGIVIIEAFASGLPVVGTPRGAVPEVIRAGDPDLIASEHSPEGIACGIKTAVDKIQSGRTSPSHFRIIAEKNFSWDGVIEQIERYYDDLITKRTKALTKVESIENS